MITKENNKTIDVFDVTGNKISTKSLVSTLFTSNNINCQAVHQAVKLYMANKRQATAKTKTRSEVSGGGRKPWRQKGTGRARAGSIRSPIWTKGGIVFGPKGNQNFKLDQNRKEYYLALCSAVSDKIHNNQLIIVNELKMEHGKTKDFVKILMALKISKVLIVVEKIDKFLEMSTSNIENVKLIDVSSINVYDVMNAKYLLMTADAFDLLNKKTMRN